MRNRLICCFLITQLAMAVAAQETIPEPRAPRPFAVSKVSESNLPNGLKMAVVRRSGVPLVTVSMVIRSGASDEWKGREGLADVTAALTVKHTPTRDADQIAEQFEFLGATLEAGADWNKTVFTFTVATDKLDAALAIFSDTIVNSTSDANELKLLKAQILDNITADLKEPSALAAFVASKYAFDEHPAGGTPASIRAITRSDVLEFRRQNYKPRNAILLFAGDITPEAARGKALKAFGKWRQPVERPLKGTTLVAESDTDPVPPSPNILVVDLPNSGQTAVSYVSKMDRIGRAICEAPPAGCRSASLFAPAAVLNSVLGGGYSARLNQEIRIKRGLSYGAGSSFAWRTWNSNFATSTQTKDVSAAEVADIVWTEIRRLRNEVVSAEELGPRKLVINGNYAREFETTEDLAQLLVALYDFGLPVSELETFVTRINAVTSDEVKKVADMLQEGQFVIAGDYGKFRDDLAKRFPKSRVRVISAEKLDLSSPTLQR